VTVGQRVNVGDKIGQTGTAGSGAHLHLELRVVDPSTPSGFRSVDPESGILGSGAMDGSTANPYVPAGPQTWQQLLKWAAQGKSLEGYGGNASRARWTMLLKAAATGSDIASFFVTGSKQSSIGQSGGVFNVSGGPLNANQQKIVDLAQQYVKKAPYVWGGHDPSGWDCSGFVSWLYKNAWGVDISTGSHYQFTQGYAIDPSQLQAGDLLFFDTAGGAEVENGNVASHVAMYIGNGQMVHAANPDLGTIISNMNDDYYRPIFLGARRYV
jgi:cell wall-associated NlpC family hydrolase